MNPNSYPPFPLSEPFPNLDANVSTNSALETPAPNAFRRYGPEDFKNLHDHMFLDKLSDSESEYSEMEDVDE